MFKLQTDYALRTLIYLARTNGQASVQEIATAYGISRDHLFKVVQQLGRLGLVRTRPGRNGGVRLGRDADAITCGGVVAGFEGRNGLLPCAETADVDAMVTSRDVGAIRDTMVQAEAAMYDALERITIAQMAQHDGVTTTPAAVAATEVDPRLTYLIA